MNREYDISQIGLDSFPALPKPEVIESTEGFRDLLHMDHALRAYKEAKSTMATSRAQKGVVLFNKETRQTFRLDGPQDLKILLYAASHAYDGARSEGLSAVATIVKDEIRAGVNTLRDMTPGVLVDLRRAEPPLDAV